MLTLDIVWSRTHKPTDDNPSQARPHQHHSTDDALAIPAPPNSDTYSDPTSLG